MCFNLNFNTTKLFKLTNKFRARARFNNIQAKISTAAFFIQQRIIVKKYLYSWTEI